MEQTKASSLIDMANGAIKERLDYEMGRVIQNISDPNTKATAKRTITVKITLEPDEERQHVEVSATASSTLAALHPVKTALAVGQEGGHTVAVELTPQIPGQFDTYGVARPRSARFSNLPTFTQHKERITKWRSRTASSRTQSTLSPNWARRPQRLPSTMSMAAPSW